MSFFEPPPSIYVSKEALPWKSMNTSTSTDNRSAISYLPVALYGSVMGMMGLSVAWGIAHSAFGVPMAISYVLGCVGVIMFIAISIGYSIKATTAPEAVRAEFDNPIAGNLFGTPLISLLLLPLILVNVNVYLARAVWIVGAVLMTLFAWLIVMRWINTRQKPAHATPAWIVPVVGMIDIPLAVPALGWAVPLHEVMLFATAVGLFFAIPLFTMILSRLMFEEPFPDSMQPTLLILLAPFSVGFSAYVTTTGQIDQFAAALYMLMLFILAVLIGRIRSLGKCCPFRFSWWAVSFPLASSSVAALRYANYSQDPVSKGIAIILLGLASLTIAALFIRTASGLLKGELRSLST